MVAEASKTQEDIAVNSSIDTTKTENVSTTDTEEYVTLDVAMKMADRSSKTIRNWLKDGSIQGQKEDPSNSKSKWLIHRSSLMAYLATSVEVDPPRRSAENLNNPSENIDTGCTSNETVSTDLTAIKQENEALKTDLMRSQKQNETLRIQLLDLEKKLAITESKVEQKDEIIDILKSGQPNLESIYGNHERRLSELQDQLTATEKELSIVRFAYEQEAGKGFFARMFTETPQLKMLEVKGDS